MKNQYINFYVDNEIRSNYYKGKKLLTFQEETYEDIRDIYNDIITYDIEGKIGVYVFTIIIDENGDISSKYFGDEARDVYNYNTKEELAWDNHYNSYGLEWRNK